MATVGFTTTDKLEAQLEQAAGGNLALSADDLVIAQRALTEAYNTIIAALAKRGVGKSDADDWLQGEEFQLDIATYRFHVLRAQLRSTPAKDADWLNKFDRREELKTATLLDSSYEEIGTTDGVADVWDLEDDD